MSILRMETDVARHVSAKLREMSELFQSQADAMYSRVENMNWQGGSRDEFVSEIDQVSSTLVAYAESCDVLRTRLDSEIAQWEETAAKFDGGAGVGNVSAGTFVEGDFINLNSKLGITILASAGSGEVLGISTAITAWGIQQQKYNTLLAQSNVLKAELGKLGSTSALQAKIDDLDDWLRELREYRDEALDKSDDFIQRLLGLDDDYEAIAGDYDITIASIEARKEKYQAQLAELNGLDTQIQNAKPPDFVKIDDGINLTPPVPQKYQNAYNTDSWNGLCSGYVQTVVPEINKTGSPSGWVNNLPQIETNSQTDLRTQVEPGDVVVWSAGQNGADDVHGHAAVIIEVYDDHVVLAESGWNGKGYPLIGRELDTEQINDLHVWDNPSL
ncbi:CHAP domain-containing protein [bacterium]|nr:CHAP domain-containing protein [bacterium]